MNWLHELRLRLSVLFRRRRFDRDIQEEMQFHLEMQAEENQANGISADESLYAAQRQFGNTMLLRETCRDFWNFRILEAFWQDLRYALRTLANARAFTAIAVFSLALGIGANTALFSLMNIMLLRALPVKNAQRLVEFIRVDGPSMMGNLPYAVFTFFRHDRAVLEDVFAVYGSDAVFRVGAAAPEKVYCHLVSGSFFPALGVNPLIGRTIAPVDEQPGSSSRPAVLSYGFWARRFGQDPSIIGSTARIDRELFAIIGVMPRDFFGVDRSQLPDLWVPFAANLGPLDEAWVLGHLKTGVLLPQARAALDPLFRQALESLRGEMQKWPERDRNAFLAGQLLIRHASNGTAALRWTYWEYSSTLKILLGLTGLVLLIACANLANLVMARSVARSREIGIRLAIGGGRWRLVRQLLTESLLVSLAGGALGLLVASWGHRLMLGFLLHTDALDFRLDYRVLAVGFALSIMTALLFGLIPAIRATCVDPSAAIHAKRPQQSASTVPLARLLLVVQVALSLVLLVGAGLFARSLRNLGTADLGLPRESLLLMDVRASGETPQQRAQFWPRLTEDLSALPGLRSVALAGDAVFGNGGWNKAIWIQRPGRPAESAQIDFDPIGPGFFATVGIPVLLGRQFGEQDRENSQKVAVVNQSFARRFFGNESPIGKRFGDDGPRSVNRYEIVGLVGDAKYGSVRDPNRPMIFQPILQQPIRDSLVLHIRTAVQPAALAPSIVRQIHRIASDALVTGVRTLPEVIRSQLRQDRMFATLAGFFAILALALGCIGIYGVVAYRVAHRSAEIGVRLALGAQRADVLRLIMRETVTLLLSGILLGAPVAIAATQLVKSLLFGLEPQDPLTITCATLTLIAAGALAGFLPARRATHIDPIAALRSE